MNLLRHDKSPSIEHPSYAQRIYDEIIANHRYGYRSLLKGESTTVSLEDRMVSRAVSMEAGVLQGLHAVIKASDELYGVLGIESAQGNTTVTALVHFQEGRRAKAVGLIGSEEKPLLIGRSYQEGLEDTTSRSHFAVYMDKSRGVSVHDLISRNGTDVVTVRSGEVPAPQELEPTGFKFFKQLLAKEGKPATNPLEDLSIWSMESTKAAELLISRS